ncbi:sporulation protein YpjB [Desmospora activa]|uniref:Sporulation protein YpjB n=1 Tax=Desmospora activa DSM 45169 TaxID=1121389 RepID=A0A2T4Z9Y9_9BACL|nr:sporulation protein YpjB [Desmospora activa]PTM58708.1 sporulation protein YpjB [Desmospora activa DSM 45169]
MRRGWFTLGVVVCLVWFSGVETAVADEDQWEQEAAMIHKEVREKKWGQARERLQVLAEDFYASSASMGWEPHEIAIISDCIVELDQVLNDSSLQPHVALTRTERLWLALDARTHPHQPLWHEYEEVFQQELDEMKKALQQGESKEVEWALEAWNHHMDQIRPAIAISFSAETSWLLEERMKTISEGAPSDVMAIEKHIKEWEALLPALFEGKAETIRHLVNVPPPIGWPLALLTTVIATVLGYVALVKYRYEQRSYTVRSDRR